MTRQLPEITPAVLAQWREAAERDIKTGQPFTLHPFAILAVIERLEAYDEARDSMDNPSKMLGMLVPSSPELKAWIDQKHETERELARTRAELAEVRRVEARHNELLAAELAAAQAATQALGEAVVELVEQKPSMGPGMLRDMVLRHCAALAAASGVAPDHPNGDKR